MKKDTPRSNRHSFRMAMAFTLGAAALLAVPAVASAGPFGRGGMGFHRRGRGGKGMGMGKLMRGDLKRLKKVLRLTPHQVKQIKQLRQANKGKMTKVRLQMARIHAKMRVQWLADKPSVWKLRKLHLQKLKLRTNMANRRFNINLKVVQILTPTQRMKLKNARGFGRRFGRSGKRGRGYRFGRFGGRGCGRGQGFGRRGN